MQYIASGRIWQGGVRLRRDRVILWDVVLYPARGQGAN